MKNVTHWARTITAEGVLREPPDSLDWEAAAKEWWDGADIGQRKRIVDKTRSRFPEKSDGPPHVTAGWETISPPVQRLIMDELRKSGAIMV